MTKARSIATVNNIEVNACPSKNNVHIWHQKFSLPILRVLFRQGHTNSYVLNYLISRYGMGHNTNIRDLQFQISNHKKKSLSREKIWKFYLLIKGDKIDVGGGFKSYTDRYTYDRKIRAAVHSVRRISIEDIRRSSMDRPPEGYTLKHVFGPNGVFQAWCPPYDKHVDRLDREFNDV